MNDLFRKKHTLWLKILFGSFSLPKGELYDELLDFANTQYRHLKWLGVEIIEEGGDFDWDREEIKLNFSSSQELLSSLVDELLAIELEYRKGTLFDRMRSDERYMLYKLRSYQDDIKIRAFSKDLNYPGLDCESKNALVQFLFEEIYKEYELIITYTYSQLHTDNAKLALIFEDLIYESVYHLKSFSTIAAKLGILAVPRVVMKEVYRFNDLAQFLKDGIEEEMAAKEQCKSLSGVVKDEELSRFFDFINNQEDYHIVLMKRALKTIG